MIARSKASTEFLQFVGLRVLHRLAQVRQAREDRCDLLAAGLFRFCCIELRDLGGECLFLAAQLFDRRVASFTTGWPGSTATSAKFSGHPCWKVQKALDDDGFDYEPVKGRFARASVTISSVLRPRSYSIIEFKDGSACRADSEEMAARIRVGELRAAVVRGGRLSNWAHESGRALRDRPCGAAKG